MEKISIMFPYEEKHEEMITKIAEDSSVTVSFDEVSNSTGDLIAMTTAVLPTMIGFISLYISTLQLKEARLSNRRVKVLNDNGQIIREVKLSELSDFIDSLK